RKIAYFFHRALQGTAAYPKAAEALSWCRKRGLVQGLLADGQCFTTLQLQRALDVQQAGLKLDEVLDADVRVLSHTCRARKPSPRIFDQAVDALAKKGIEAHEVLHVGSSLPRDIGPAKKL